MFDANGVICTDIHKAYLDLFVPDEIRKTAVIQIETPVVFEGDVPKEGGLHDLSMGPFDNRTRCKTCGGTKDCPGHLGYIDLPIPLFHPLFITSLIKLLKCICFYCYRFKLSNRTIVSFIVKFELIRYGLESELETFDSIIQNQATPSKSTKTEDKTSNTHEATSLSSRLLDILNKLKVAKNGELHQLKQKNIKDDISKTHQIVELWSGQRQLFFDLAMKRKRCSHCKRSMKFIIKQNTDSCNIIISWPHGSTLPLDSSFLSPLYELISNVSGDNFIEETVTKISHKSHIETSYTNDGQVLNVWHLYPYQLFNLLKKLWAFEKIKILNYLFPISLKNGSNFFFFECLPVNANRFRPLTVSQSSNFSSQSISNNRGYTLHQRTLSLIDVMMLCEKINSCLAKIKDYYIGFLETERSSNSYRNIDAITYNKELKLFNFYSNELQQVLNQYIDSSKTNTQSRNSPAPGIKQLLEKKEGIIRQKMMGKRVNFSARTVIAPDNCINTNEIGIPLEFAKRLTIAEFFTTFNVSYLKKLIENGCEIYPGANSVEDSHGVIYDLRKMSKDQRRNKALVLAMDTLTNSANPPIVHRHVQNGDIVLMNRQPSLHRASIMAHYVRVLQGWKTFRLMYVNCSSYNADFDGDEMNLHLPQDFNSRAEAKMILDADNQYVTCKNGEPLRGLIQDHIIGGTFLTSKNTFLTKNEYFTILYVGLESFVKNSSTLHIQSFETEQNSLLTSCVKNGSDLTFNCPASKFGSRISIEPPAIIYPKELWTGKQVITSILKTILSTTTLKVFRNNVKCKNFFTGLNYTGKSKTPANAWNGIEDHDEDESNIIIRDSELIQGVVDKAMIGSSFFSFIHFCYEALGADVAGTFLNIFAKTFICFLQMNGFTCSPSDFLMTPEGECRRQNIINQCFMSGNYLQEAFIDSVYKKMGVCERYSSLNREPYKRPSHSIESTKLRLSPSSILDSNSLDSGISSSKAFYNSFLQSYYNTQYQLKRKLSPSNQTVDSGIKYLACLSNKSGSINDISFQDIEKCKKMITNVKQFNSNLSRSYIPFINDTPKNKLSMPISTEMSEIQHLGSNNSSFNPWKLLRSLTSLQSQFSDSATRNEINSINYLDTLYNWIVATCHKNERLKASIIAAFLKISNLQNYFPRLSTLLNLNFSSVSMLEKNNTNVPEKDFSSVKHIDSIFPEPNFICKLPNGNVTRGNGSSRQPVTYHPSWVFENKSCIDFENPIRYVCNASQSYSILNQESNTTSLDNFFCVHPNIISLKKFDDLISNHFVGKEKSLLNIADHFLQYGMGSILSQNNELVSGNVTLYKFPNNGFSSMILTGAKGSKVNFSMICGMLSQQSLEGKRVPVMISCKTLPSFARFDIGPRAGGLITDRYLTGLRPQEYFFHCMAGREGLVDTAIKTARSGYLQRCLIKGMEGVITHHDGTVRDSDNTVIQFLYGEDGLEISKASYMSKLEDLLQNPVILWARYNPANKISRPNIQQSIDEVEKYIHDHKSLFLQSATKSSNNGDIDPCLNKYNPVSFAGSCSEKYRNIVKELVDASSHQVLSEILKFDNETAHTNDIVMSKKNIKKAKSKLTEALLMKYSESLCEAGEAVGCLSAQSIGEPATQMTLNTFHLAGHGAANVTLGIPRLKEILQTANITKTPYIYIPIKGESKLDGTQHMEDLLLNFKKIPLTDIIHGVGIEHNIYKQVNSKKNQNFNWEYEVTIQLENLNHFCKVVPKFTPSQIFTFILIKPIREMLRQVNKLLYIYSTKYADEELNSSDDELEDIMDQFIVERNTRSHIKKRDMRKKLTRVTMLDGSRSNNNDTINKSTTDEDYLKDDNMNKQDIAESDEVDKDKVHLAEKNSDDLENQSSSVSSNSSYDSEHSEVSSQSNQLSGDEDNMQDEDQDSWVNNKSVISRSNDQESLSSYHSVDEMKKLDENITETCNESFNHESFNFSHSNDRHFDDDRFHEKTNSSNVKFDSLLEVIDTDFFDGDGLEIPANHIWSNFEILKWKYKPLSRNEYSLITDLKFCPVKWKILLKFGWPIEKCPRRIVFLKQFVRILKKQKLLDTPGINSYRIVGGNQTETKVPYEIQCQGTNLVWVSRLDENLIDHYRVRSNDIQTIQKFYGIEACRSVIIDELNKVFFAYGIKVNFRHLTLIADKMTHSGTLKPFNRSGIEHHNSPFLQMSFETSMRFLTKALERGAYDDLKSPAGSIFTGKKTLVGGSLSQILTKLKYSTFSKDEKSPLTKKRSFNAFAVHSDGMMKIKQNFGTEANPDGFMKQNVTQGLVNSNYAETKPNHTFNTRKREFFFK